MSLRSRLILLYSSILLLAMLAGGLLTYLSLAHTSLSVIEQTLSDEADRLVAQQPFPPQFSQTQQLDQLALPVNYVQVVDTSGSVTWSNAASQQLSLPLSDQGLAALRSGQTWLETVELDSGRLLVYGRPVSQDIFSSGFITVGRSLADLDQSLSTLRMLLLGAGLLVLLIALAAGWVTLGAALRPIAGMTRAIRAIGSERDLARRVEYRGPEDEVGQLAITLNTMLAELQDAHEQLGQALGAQHRFVADASHELRTPLTTIRGNLGLLQREPPIAEQDRAAVLGDMVEETERLMRLVQNLLLLARGHVGKELRPQHVALPALVEELCRQLQPLGDQRPMDYAQVDGAALADRDALKQVLLILLDNALRYTPPGGSITIWSQTEDGLISLCVRDSGAGIEPAVLPFIFERFYRADPARSGGGSGLGLAIARTLVEAMGGSIAAESPPGQGATFRVRLPRSEQTCQNA